ncbi:MAG: hypothetical protein KA902_06850 [Arenimonas sp.]|nr:hypothetical protein [Arenimonas sp.]
MTKDILPKQAPVHAGHNLDGLQILLMFALFTIGVSDAFASATGRWLGVINIPDKTVNAIVDLDQDDSDRWIGSISLPQLNVTAAPLTDIKASNSQVSFSIINVLGDPIRGPATFQAQLETADTMTGDFTQAGNRARFRLQRDGIAQVTLPPRSTAVSKELVGTWIGDFIGIGGYARHVTLTLRNQDKLGATAKFIVVGKQTTDVPVDLVTYAESLLTVKSNTTEINFEGRYNPVSAEISGMFELGSFEFPLLLKRSKEGNTP